MRLWWVNEREMLTRADALRRMIDSPDDSPDMARRGHRYLYDEPDGSVSYVPRYMRLFGKKKGVPHE